jgi:Zn-dependent peptidase ImmA (M78 family)
MTITATAPAASTPDDELSARMRLLGLTPPAAAIDIESGVLERMRAVCPRRPLSWHDAEQIAERQAGILRRELDNPSRSALSTSALFDLPFLTVTYRDGFPTSGMAMKTGLGWVILIKSDEPIVRQRFSLAHEIKHIVDDELMTRLDRDLYPATRLYSAEERGERVADRFAAALLMPTMLIRRDWADGLQDIAVLAGRYDVSRVAMEVRLRQLGLLQATPRCVISTAGEHPEGPRQ